MTAPSIISPQVLDIGVGETKLLAFDFTLASEAIRYGSETLTGTPTVTATPDGLTIGTPAVNAATFYRKDGTAVAIGKGVQVSISGAADGTRYTVVCLAGSTASNTYRLEGILQA